MSISLGIAGNGVITKLNSFVKEAEAEIRRAEKRVLDKAGTVLLREARKAAPVGTGEKRKHGTGKNKNQPYKPGNLKRSMRKKVHPHSVTVGATYPEGAHSIPIHFGHDIVIVRGDKAKKSTGHSVQPNKYMDKAKEAAAPEVQRILSETWL